MPYLNLYVHRRRKVFVASAHQDTRIVLPSFYREERVPVAVRMVDDDPANGLGALAELDISSYTCKVAIGTPGNSTPLALQQLTWDADRAAFVGVLVLLTDEMIAALDAALPASYISKKFEVELQKDNGGVDDEEITAEEDCVVRNEVIFGGSPLNLALQLFPSVLFGALRVDSPIDTGDTPVNPTGEDSVIVGGVAGTTYTVRVRVKGTVETRNYTGGSVADPLLPYFYTGGSIDGGNTRNIYKLEISDPPQTYYLNHDADPVEVVDLDYVVAVQMAAGATITLSYDSIDNLQIGDQELAVYFAGSFAHNGVVPASAVPTTWRDATLSGPLRLECPASAPRGTYAANLTDQVEVTVNGHAGRLYQLDFRVRGLNVTTTFSGGTNLGMINIGGARLHPSSNPWTLTISDPPQVINLNAAETAQDRQAIDYLLTVVARAGATLTLAYDTIDLGLDVWTEDILVPGVNPTRAVFNGHFMQLDLARAISEDEANALEEWRDNLVVAAIKVTDETPAALAATFGSMALADNTSRAFRIQARAEHASPDGEVVAADAWFIDGLIRRGASAGSTVLDYEITHRPPGGSSIGGLTEWSLVAAADTSGGGLLLTFTGEAAKAISVSAQIQWL